MDTQAKTVKVRRLYHGMASCRDYEINDLIKRGLDLILECNGSKMFIPNSQIFAKGKRTDLNIKSKFNDRSYTLIDFPFKPNQTNPNQQTLFGVSYG